eukprot:364653-Chlamydomonas_euryale.AAC.1
MAIPWQLWIGTPRSAKQAWTGTPRSAKQAWTGTHRSAKQAWTRTPRSAQQVPKAEPWQHRPLHPRHPRTVQCQEHVHAPHALNKPAAATPPRWRTLRANPRPPSPGVQSGLFASKALTAPRAGPPSPASPCLILAYAPHTQAHDSQLWGAIVAAQWDSPLTVDAVALAGSHRAFALCKQASLGAAASGGGWARPCEFELQAVLARISSCLDHTGCRGVKPAGSKAAGGSANGCTCPGPGAAAAGAHAAQQPSCQVLFLLDGSGSVGGEWKRKSHRNRPHCYQRPSTLHKSIHTSTPPAP